jgi:hypothetical protein
MKMAANPDVADFVDYKLHTLPNSLFENDQDRANIGRMVIEKSNGSLVKSPDSNETAKLLRFLWAKLAIDELANATDSKKMIEYLSNTSPSLETLFANSMTTIENLSEQEKRFAKTALAWVLLANRPLEEAELRHALAIEDGSSGLDPNNIPDVIQITTSCRPFLVLSAMGWFIVHASAADYLLRILDIWCPNAKALIAKGCLTYLAFDRFSEGHCKTGKQLQSRLAHYPFYRYAALYWVNHLQEVQDVPENAVCSFLLDQSKIASARQVMLIYKQEPHEQGSDQLFDDHESGLHLAAQFGLDSVTTLLLEKGQRPAAKDTQGRTPLWRATEECRTETMKLLSSRDRTSFTLMLNMKRVQLAHSLLQVTGQNIRDSRSRTPLHIGAIRNDPDLIRLSIAHGLSVNATDMDGHTPIQLAIENDASQAIDLLLTRAARTDLIIAKDWLKAYGKPESDVVKLVEDTNGEKRVTFLKARNIQREGPTTDVSKRLL